MKNRKIIKLSIQGDSNYEMNNDFKALNLLAHSVIELLMYYLGKVYIDGNNYFLISIKERDPNKGWYDNDPYFNVSEYIVNADELKEARDIQKEKHYDPIKANNFFINLIKRTLINICSNSGNEAAIPQIEEASRKVIESNFELKYKINKFSKKSEDSLYKASAYRHITPDGENYYLEVLNMQSKEIDIYQLNKQPEYVKMELMYTKAFWDNHDFHLYSDDYHKDIVVINVDDHTIIINKT